MSIIYSSLGSRCCCVIWTSATIAAAWLRHGTDYCAFLLERREPDGVPRPCGHSCMACATVCLTVMPSSDITNVSTISHSFKTDRSHTPLFHIVQYQKGHCDLQCNQTKDLNFHGGAKKKKTSATLSVTTPSNLKVGLLIWLAMAGTERYNSLYRNWT